LDLVDTIDWRTNCCHVWFIHSSKIRWWSLSCTLAEWGSKLYRLNTPLNRITKIFFSKPRNYRARPWYLNILLRIQHTHTHSIIFYIYIYIHSVSIKYTRCKQIGRANCLFSEDEMATRCGTYAGFSLLTLRDV